MTEWPRHTPVLDREIVDLLTSLPLEWLEQHAAEVTATGKEALQLLERAGLVERRLTLRATMEGQPEAVELIVIISGEGTPPLIPGRIFAAVPHWTDGDGRTKGRFHINCRSAEIRISSEGAQARHDYLHRTTESPSAVLAFVHGRGLFSGRSASPARLRVQSCRVDAVAGQSSGTPDGAGEVPKGSMGAAKSGGLPSGAGDPPTEFRAAAWFKKGASEWLRKASAPARKTKRVRCRSDDGVKVYCVEDVQKWRPDLLPGS